MIKTILTIIGARPQFIKAAAISKEIMNTPGLREIIIHTGQHYDKGLSNIFFDELVIPKPKHSLSIGSGSHGFQTGNMLFEIEQILVNEKPRLVLVYGDTNSTLAGALAAVKLQIPIAHIEAGLRSFNRKMPEEINRIITDQISSLLFTSSDIGIKNLLNEGIKENVFNTGDVMYDCIRLFSPLIKPDLTNLDDDKFEKGTFVLATIHRAENTDDETRLRSIFEALEEIADNIPLVMPLHPRTKKYLNLYDIKINNIMMLDPVSYLEMLVLSTNAKTIITDSGGLQKEAFWLDVPCITVRDETEWTETLAQKRNVLTGANTDVIVKAFNSDYPASTNKNVYGDGFASKKIIQHIKEFLSK